MKTIPNPANAKAWRELYVAALLEPDGAKLSERIAQAEWAMVLRARELFHAATDSVEEEEALDNAMYSLNALRNLCRLGQSPAHASTDAA